MCPTDNTTSGARSLTYRITGELANRRVRPLLLSLPGLTWREADRHEDNLDFVWETHVPREWKNAHDRAHVLNRLCNSVISENKAQYALVQSRMTLPTLETFILRGHEVEAWVKDRWGTSTGEEEKEKEGEVSGRDWWMLKATGANGGMDVWVLHKGVQERVLAKVQPSELYVVQRYVRKPMLYKGRKFHFRCYALLRGDLQPFLYRHAYILAATNQYNMDDTEDLTHLTNLSVNKHVSWYPGEIPCCLPNEYPEAFERMKEVWAETIRAAAPFMASQVSARHFEFFGLDFIVEEDGSHAWLLEVNRLPGITSSKQNKAEEDRFFDAVVSDVLKLCVVPALSTEGSARPPEVEFEAVAKPEGVEVEACAPGEGWRNVLRFGMFSKKAIRKDDKAVKVGLPGPPSA